jgi:hypothetical protein
MPILNKKTGEVMSIETYKKRRELEEHWGEHTGALNEWSKEEIEFQWYKEFQGEKMEMDIMDSQDQEEEMLID